MREKGEREREPDTEREKGIAPWLCNQGRPKPGILKARSSKLGTIAVVSMLFFPVFYQEPSYRNNVRYSLNSLEGLYKGCIEGYKKGH